MPIRPPALDDRRFDDLVVELIERIPAHVPEWTNPRVGDPGRSLIELFAFLGDALLYRGNLIPERQRLVFLRLLGQPLRAARPARGIVTLSLKETEQAAAFSLRPRATLPGPPPFETKAEVTVLPATAQVYYKKKVELDKLPVGMADALASVHEIHGGLNPYETTSIFTEGRPESGGFDIITQTADRFLWIALLAPKAPPAEQEAKRTASRTAMGRADGGGQIINIGFVPALPSVDPLAPISARARIPHVWEVTANTTSKEVTANLRWVPEYLALDRLSDTTNGLTQAGVIQLRLPPSRLLHAPTNDLREDTNAGVGDRPPRIDDATVTSRIVAWLRLRAQPAAPPTTTPKFKERRDEGVTLRGPDITTPPSVVSSAIEHLRLSWIGINAVEAEQLVTRTNQVFAESNGSADQEFQLPATSVEAETLNIEIEADIGWVRWDRVDDLSILDRDANLSRDAHAFQLDAEAGTVRFGDGVRGRIPAAGRRIRFTQLRAGGGRAGNLPAGTLKKISATTHDGDNTVGGKLTVQQSLAFDGGENAETLIEAEKRIPARLRHRERAVTASDYDALARETPGVSVGRVEILPRFKPQQRHFNVPGVVSVMALPDAPLGPAPNPRADRPFLEAVHTWLDTRRPLGTELYVIGCEYVPVAVSVAISIREDTGEDATLQAVKDALRRVLWPLPGGGFQKAGWPLGCTISNRELAVEVARVEGVSEVNALHLFQHVNNAWTLVPRAGDCAEQDLELSPWQLPELLAVVALVGNDAPLAPAPADVPPNAVAVPIVPEIC